MKSVAATNLFSLYVHDLALSTYMVKSSYKNVLNFSYFNENGSHLKKKFHNYNLGIAMRQSIYLCYLI